MPPSANLVSANQCCFSHRKRWTQWKKITYFSTEKCTIQSPKDTGNRKTRFLRKVLKVRKVDMNSPQLFTQFIINSFVLVNIVKKVLTNWPCKSKIFIFLAKLHEKLLALFVKKVTKLKFGGEEEFNVFRTLIPSRFCLYTVFHIWPALGLLFIYLQGDFCFTITQTRKITSNSPFSNFII